MTIAQPEDHKSATFKYTFLSGKTLVLPQFDSIMTFGRARRLRKADEGEQMFALVEEVCDETALAVLDEMDLAETQTFFEAWQNASGVSVGESASSSA